MSALPAGKKNLRVLVCGGRDFANEVLVAAALDAVHTSRGIAVVIQGEARGADLFGKRWAEGKNIPVLPFPADWDAHGKRAGFLRNEQMLRDGKPDCVVAFPGGRGTEMMVRIAKQAGVPVWRPIAV